MEYKLLLTDLSLEELLYNLFQEFLLTYWKIV